MINVAVMSQKEFEKEMRDLPTLSMKEIRDMIQVYEIKAQYSELHEREIKLLEALNKEFYRR